MWFLRTDSKWSRKVLHRGTDPENKKQAGYAQFFATPPLEQGFSTEGVDGDIGADAFIEAFLIGWVSSSSNTYFLRYNVLWTVHDISISSYWQTWLFSQRKQVWEVEYECSNRPAVGPKQEARGIQCKFSDQGKATTYYLPRTWSDTKLQTPICDASWIIHWSQSQHFTTVAV